MAAFQAASQSPEPGGVPPPPEPPPEPPQAPCEVHGLPLPADVQVQVLHIVQEALSNVRKHAGASQVWVDVTRAPAWRIEVRDDGRGFDPAEHAPDETHVGLRIMNERARRIGATVTVQGRPDEGAQVILSLPDQTTVVPDRPVAQAA